MPYASLVISVSPNGTAYDEDYPTRSTELYSNQLHNMLVDMEDASGSWYLTDDSYSATMKANIGERMHDMIEDVFDYVEGAIDTYRATGTPTLAKPTQATIAGAYGTIYRSLMDMQFQLQGECFKICYLAYYMWKTEEDPLLLKEKLQELLISWPLLDTTIELNTETGQELKFYPSWKNVDL